MRLIAIQEDGTLGEQIDDLSGVAANVIESIVEVYQSGRYESPWTGYLAVEDGRCVGTCAFKSPPVENSVEIAYFTFPDEEGRGVATRMAAELVRIARNSLPEVAIIAQTVRTENASTSVLRKTGFVLAAEKEHPEDGLVWEWTYMDPRDAGAE